MVAQPITHTMVSFDPVDFPKAAQLFHAAHSGKYRVIVTGGAVRGGKSFGVGGVLMTLHKRFPYSRSIVVRDTIETLRNTTLETVNKLIPPSFIKKYRSHPQYHWRFHNGSSFQFFAEQDTQDPERKRWNGLEVNYIWLEQIEELNEETFLKSLERVGSYFIPKHLGEQPDPIIFITLNPTDTWARKFYTLWQKDELPVDWLYIPSSITDNAALPESYRKSLLVLKKESPIKYARFVEGDWEAREKTGNEWLHRFDRGVHVGEVPYLPDQPTYLTFDFNSVPYMTMLCAQIIEKGEGVQVRFYAEYCLPHPKNRSEDCITAWNNDYPETYGHTSVFYTGDASGNNRIPGYGDMTAFLAVVSTLKRFGLWHNTSSLVYRQGYQNAWVRDFCNDLLAGKFDIEVIVDQDCPILIRDLEHTLENIDGGPFKKKIKDPKTGVTYEENGHCTDAYKALFLGCFSKLFEPYKKRRRDAFNQPGGEP